MFFFELNNVQLPHELKQYTQIPAIAKPVLVQLQNLTLLCSFKDIL